MELGANLENTSLKWLDQLTALENGTVERNNRVLATSAERLVQELAGVYDKINNKGTGTYEAQQLNARLQNMQELLPPGTQKTLQKTMQADLLKAQQMGGNSAVNLAELLGATSNTLSKTAKPNIPAIENAGKRLDTFWAKENGLFRDRVTALTQAAAAEGKSWRLLSNQVRELLYLEKKAGTESARSTAVNAKLGITARAELIARTEMATAYVQGQVARMKEMGYDWARWSASAERGCPYCIARDGLVYVLEDVESSIPAHPRCRCNLIPVDAPNGWKKGDKYTDGEGAVGDLDDAYWAKSRADKLTEYRQAHPDYHDGQLIQYINTPTNSQAYFFPGAPAPRPIWAPSGSWVPNLAALSNNLAAAVAAAEKAAALKKQLEEEEKKKQEELKKQQEELAKKLAEEAAKEDAAMLRIIQSGATPDQIAQLKTVWDKLAEAEKVKLVDLALKPIQKLAEKTYGISKDGFDGLGNNQAKWSLYEKVSDKAFDYVVKGDSPWQQGDKPQWDYSTTAADKLSTYEMVETKRAQAKAAAEAEALKKQQEAEAAAKKAAEDENIAMLKIAGADITSKQDKKDLFNEWDDLHPTTKMQMAKGAEPPVKLFIQEHLGIEPDAYDALPTFVQKVELLNKAIDKAWSKIEITKQDWMTSDAMKKDFYSSSLSYKNESVKIAEDWMIAQMNAGMKAATLNVQDPAAKTPDEGPLRERANELKKQLDEAQKKLLELQDQVGKDKNSMLLAQKALAHQEKLKLDLEAELKFTEADLAAVRKQTQDLQEARDLAMERLLNLGSRKEAKMKEWEGLNAKIKEAQAELNKPADLGGVDPKAERLYNENLSQQHHTLDSLMEVGRDVLRRAGIDDVKAFDADPDLLELQRIRLTREKEIANLERARTDLLDSMKKEFAKAEKTIAEQRAQGKDALADTNAARLLKMRKHYEAEVERRAENIQEKKEGLGQLDLEIKALKAKSGGRDPQKMAEAVIAELVRSSPITRDQAVKLVEQAASVAARKAENLRPLKELGDMVDAVQFLGGRLSMDAYGLKSDRAHAMQRRVKSTNIFDANADVVFAPNATGYVNSGRPGSFRFRQVQFHELAHHLEFLNNDVFTSAHEFILSRATSTKSMQLRKIIPGSNYGSDEYAYPGKSINPYVLKDYTHYFKKNPVYGPNVKDWEFTDRRWQVLGSATEVISMGVERLAKPELLAELAVADPEHLLLALGSVRLQQARNAQVDSGQGQVNSFQADANTGANRVDSKSVERLAAGRGEKQSTPEEIKARQDELKALETQRARLELQINRLSADEVKADQEAIKAQEKLDLSSDLAVKEAALAKKQIELSDEIKFSEGMLKGYEQAETKAIKAWEVSRDQVKVQVTTVDDLTVSSAKAVKLADLRDIGLKSMNDKLAGLTDAQLKDVAIGVGLPDTLSRAELTDWLYHYEGGGNPYDMPLANGKVYAKPSEVFDAMFPSAPPATAAPDPGPAVTAAKATGLSKDQAIKYGEDVFGGPDQLDNLFSASEIKQIYTELGLNPAGKLKSEMIQDLHQLEGGNTEGLPVKKGGSISNDKPSTLVKDIDADIPIYVPDPAKYPPGGPTPKQPLTPEQYDAAFVNEWWFQKGPDTVKKAGFTIDTYLTAGPATKAGLLTKAKTHAQLIYNVKYDPPATTTGLPAPVTQKQAPMPDLKKLSAADIKALVKETGNSWKGKKDELIAQLEQLQADKPGSVSNAWASLKGGSILPDKKIKIKPIADSPLDSVFYEPIKATFDNNGLAVEGMTLVEGPTLAGSTRPKLYQDSSGKAVYVLKSGGGANASGQNVAEWASQRIYNILGTKEIGGVKSHQVKDPSGKVRLVNEFVDGARTIDKLDLKANDIYRKVRSTHLQDALLANWDYIGLSGDNIAMGADGKLYKIDAGGTFNFRAQGSSKSYTDIPWEMWTLREGQGKKAWSSAKEGDYKHLWTTQIDKLRSVFLDVADVVRYSDLDADVKQAFYNRQNLLLGTGKLIKTEKFNVKGHGDMDIEGLVENGLLTWKQVDQAVKDGWESKRGIRADADWEREILKAVKEKMQEAVDTEVERKQRVAGGGDSLVPGSTSWATQRAIRGGSKNHNDSLWGSGMSSGSNKAVYDPKVVENVKNHLEQVYGRPFSKTEVGDMLKVVHRYTDGEYQAMIAAQLYRNKPEAFDNLPDHYKSALPSDPKRRDELFKEIDDAQVLLSALPVWTGGEIYRGMRLKTPEARLRHLEVVTTGSVEQVISYSSDINRAYSFDGGDYPVIFHIPQPKTVSSVRGLSHYANEAEVLVHKHVKLQVDYFSLNADGSDPFQADDPRALKNAKLHVFMREVEP